MTMCNCNQGRLPCTCKTVPPAGGEPVIYALSCYNDVGGYAPKMVARETLPQPETRDGYVLETDHHTHVTRLQAEVELWRGRTSTLCIAIADMRTELTKAREALEEPFQLVFEGYNRPATDFATDAAWGTWQQAQLTKAFSLLQALRRELSANQSAPADKGEECIHDFRMFSGECHKCGADWIPGKEYAPAEKVQGEP